MTRLLPNDIVKTCAYCNKVGHNILKCFKSIKDQAASKSDGNLDNKKGVAVPTITRQDELVEENTGFSSFPTIVRNSGSYTAFLVFIQSSSAINVALAKLQNVCIPAYLKRRKSLKLTTPFWAMKQTRTTSSGMPTWRTGKRSTRTSECT